MNSVAMILRRVTFVTLAVCIASRGNAETCLVAHNSTSPKGYFVFDHVWFPTPKPETYAGPVDGSDFIKACGAKCIHSKYGFYTRTHGMGVENACYCLTSEPDYTKPEVMWGEGFYTKKCPKVKAPPPPPLKRGPPPPRPPPPLAPTRCAVRYNSSDPYGFFYFQHSVQNGRPIYTVNATNGFDVWPQQGATTRCSLICKNYKWGFFITSGKYTNDANCFCLRSAMTYETETGGSYFTVFFSKSCPKKKGRHPPGIGKHPPGVGGH